MIRASREEGSIQRTLVVLMVLALVGVLFAVGARPAHAATFTVNSIGDGTDTDTGDGNCFAGFMDDGSGGFAGECTLRAAIQQANADAKEDLIAFNITTGMGTIKTIKPNSELPLITAPVTIDGYSQGSATADTADDAKPNTLAHGSNATLKIELDGSTATTAGATDGLQIGAGASGSVVKGLAVNRFRRGIIIVSSRDNKVEGNFVGTDPSGTQGLGNLGAGVAVFSSSSSNNFPNNFIGGTTAGARNLISGNGRTGVFISIASGNRVEGNLIGTKKNGTDALGNSDEGVLLDDRSSDNFVGGVAPGAANTIAFNGQGVAVVSSNTGNSTGNRIFSNSILENVRLGIDLGLDGVTSNDPQDPDTGVNNLQNYPVFTSARTSRRATTVKGTLNSTPGQTFILQFFSSAAADPSGNGEGKIFIGETSVTTDANGDASFGFKTKKPKVPKGQFVTATATSSIGDTSEFSNARKVVR